MGLKKKKIKKKKKKKINDPIEIFNYLYINFISFELVRINERVFKIIVNIIIII